MRRDIELVIASGANQTTFYPLMTSPSVRRSLSDTVGQVEYSREADFYALIVEELSRAVRAFDSLDLLAQGRRADR